MWVRRTIRSVHMVLKRVQGIMDDSNRLDRTKQDIFRSIADGFNRSIISPYTNIPHAAISPLIAKILSPKIQYFESPLCVLNSYWCYGLSYLPQHDFQHNLQFTIYNLFKLRFNRAKIWSEGNTKSAAEVLTGLPQRVGERPAATQAAIQALWAALHARIAAGTPTPPVETPATRVVTKYMGSGINSKNWGGIRNHSAEIWDHKPWDRDQHYCKGIRDPVFRHNIKDHKILKCALIGGTCQHFSIQLYFCGNISIRY